LGEDLFKSIHGVPGPTKTKVIADFGQQSLEPVSLTGVGVSFSPSALLKTVREATADIGNGGLKAAPIIARASGHHQPTVRAAIAAHRKRVSTAIKIPDGESVSPHASATARTAIRLGPWKILTKFKDTLDGGFDEKYQWRCFREYHPHLPGAAGVATPTAPTPLPKPE
jgi:hypothetical protein